MSSAATVAITPAAIFERLSPSSKRALAVANAFRERRNRDAVHMEHLLVGLYEKPDGPTMEVFQHAGLFPDVLRKKLIEAELDAPDTTERVSGVSSTRLLTVDEIGVPPDLKPIEVMPRLSTHVEQALQAAAMMPASNPPQGRIQSRHLLNAAFSIEECDVIRLFAHLRPAVVALLSEEPATGAAPPAPAAVPADTGGGAGAANDRAEGKDQLHFTHYVQAFTDLIESPETQPPLVIGIFGSWGAGKSFLLTSLTKSLARRREQLRLPLGRRIGRLLAQRIWPRSIRWRGRQPAYVYTVSFNAWEYNAAAKIWPRLVRRVLDTVNNEVRWRTRPVRWCRKAWRNLRRNFFRKLRAEWAALAGWIVVGGAIAWLVVGVLPDNFERTLNRLLGIDVNDAKFSFVAGIGGLVAAVKLLVDSFFAPFGGWVTAVLNTEASYGGEEDAMRAIREDLDLLDRQLRAEKSRIVIVVDDLDRCEPEKAIEVLQAINLMLDRDSFIVALGIDARVITAAVEKHYKDLLGPAGITGYEYLDKIVQIPFRIPEPTSTDVSDFLASQLGEPRPPSEGSAGADDRHSGTRGQSTGEPVARLPETPPITPERRQQLEKVLAVGTLAADRMSEPARTAMQTGIDTGRGFLDVPAPLLPPLAFSYAELTAFQAIAGHLRPNPRHIKRLVNVYALVRALAERLDERRILEQPSTTVIWLALCAQWPYATREMLRRHDALERERAAAIAGERPFAYPATAPLRHLLESILPGLDPAHRRRFDHDNESLEQLIAASGEMTWDQLRTLRRFTLNFNPALDSELRVSERRTTRRVRKPAAPFAFE